MPLCRLLDLILVFCQLVIDLYQQSKFQEAIDTAKSLLELNPKSAFLYNIIGAANQGLGKLDDAIVAYKKALSIKPDYADAHYNMGTVLQDQGKLGEALEAYNKLSPSSLIMLRLILIWAMPSKSKASWGKR